MRGRLIVLSALIAFSTSCFCQKQQKTTKAVKAPTYNWSWKKDGTVLASSLIGYGSTRYLMNKSSIPTLAEINKLNAKRLPSFDRGAIFNFSENAGELSDMFLYSSAALPLLTLFDKSAFSEKGAIIGMMFETILINTTLTNSFKASTSRFRPYAYTLNLREETSIGPTTNQSFISGHTSTVAAMSFFSAKVLSDMHPDSKWKPVIWASAFMIPATTGYLRYKAGKHFPSDVIAGYSFGALIGFLVPHFHKITGNGDVRLGVLPVGGAVGLSLDMNLNKEKVQEEYVQF